MAVAVTTIQRTLATLALAERSPLSPWSGPTLSSSGKMAGARQVG